MSNYFKTLLNMFLAVIGYTLDPVNKTITQSVPAWDDLNLSLKDRTAAINSLVKSQAQQLKGYAAHKKALKEAASQMVYSITKPTLAYARANSLEVLTAKMKLSMSDLRTTDDSVFAQVMGGLITDANAYIADLGPYSVTAAMITSATASVTAYSEFMSTPRNKVGERKATTQALNLMVHDTNDFVRFQMDPLSVAMKSIDENYFNSYLAMRKHVPVHNGTTKIRVLVLDEVTGKPVPLVVAVVDETDLSAITDINGKCSINTVPRGIRRITVTCKNYMPFTSEYVSLIQGTFTDITVSLHPAFDIPAPAPDAVPVNTQNN